MVVCLKNLFGCIYSYFCRNDEHYVELQKLAKCILSKYKILMVKMGVGMTLVPSYKDPVEAKDNLDLLVDIKFCYSYHASFTC